MRRSRSLLAAAFGFSIFQLASAGHAQQIIRLGLQGDNTLRTAGGWIHPASPAGNPMASPPSAYFNNTAQLGKALFWDEQVSTGNTMACGTCHMPEVGGVDPRAAGATFTAAPTPNAPQPVLGSFGVIPQAPVGGPAGPIDYGFTAPPSTQETRLVTPIHVPTMVGAYVFERQFWNMRAGPTFNDSLGAVLFPQWASLENQSVGPPTSSVEMGHQNLLWNQGVIQAKLNAEAPLALVVAGTVPASIPAAWLTSTYRNVFDTVFAADPNPQISAPNGVTRERFAMALASYMRTLVPDQAPIDNNTMTTQELQGFDIFVNSGCGTCHSVSNALALVNRTTTIGTLTDAWDNSFSDGLAHDIFAGSVRSIGPIKTPTLRNVGLRTRFFHDGRGRLVGGAPQNTIGDIVDFYDIDQNPANGGPGGPFELQGSGYGSALTPTERAAVIAFLGNALTDPRVAARTAPFDRPTLYSESVPFSTNLTRPATASPAGWTPLMIADVPPLVEMGTPGTNWWKVGVGSAGGGVGGILIPPNSQAALWMGATDTAPGPFWLTGPTNLVTILTTPQGFATAQGPVILTPPMIGTTFFLQWVIFDPVTANVGHSESARLTVL